MVPYKIRKSFDGGLKSCKNCIEGLALGLIFMDSNKNTTIIMNTYMQFNCDLFLWYVDSRTENGE